MLSSLIAIVCLPQGQISLTTGVIRVPDLVTEMATKSGEPLTASVALRNEVVYVNLKPRQLPELMNLVAQTTGTEWVKDGKRVELTKTSKKLREDEALDKQRDLQALTLSLAKVPKFTNALTLDSALQEIENYKKLSKDLNKNNQAMKASLASIRPSYRLLSNLLHAKDPSWILSVPYGKRAAFASQPTRTQKPLPFSTSGLVAQYTAERKIMSSAVSNSVDQDRSLRVEILGYGSLAVQANWSPPLKAMVMVNRHLSNTFDISVHVYDSSGEPLDFTAISIDNLPENRPKHPLSSEIPPATQYPLHPIQASFRKYILHKKEDASTLDILRDPMGNEPLEVLTEAPLGSFFKDIKKEAFLSLPDALASQFLSLTSDQIGAGQLLAFIDETMVTEMRGGCLMGKPRRPHLSWQARVDRWVMRDLFRASSFGMPIPLDSWAAYAAKQSELAPYEAIEGRWLSYGIFGKPVVTDLETLSGRNGLKLWNSFSEQQRNAVRNGSQVPVGTLSAKPRSILTTIVFEQHASHTMTGATLSTLLSNVLPNGIPADAYLESKPANLPLFLVETEAGLLDIVSPDRAAFIFCHQQLGNPLDPDSASLNMAGALFKPMDFMLLRTKIKLAPNVTTEIIWTDYRYDPSAQAAPGETLKGPAGEEYRKKLAEYRKRFGG